MLQLPSWIRIVWRCLAARRGVRFVLALCSALPTFACSDGDAALPLDAGQDAATPDAALGPEVKVVDDTSDLEVNPDWWPYPQEAELAGQTLEELALSWSHWRLSQSDCVRNAANDRDGALCAVDQAPDSAVFFLAPGDFGTTRSDCTVSAKQALLVPLSYFYADGVSSPLGIDTPADKLEGEAQNILASMRDLVLVLDGRPFDVTTLRPVGPLSFAQMFPSQGNYYQCSGYEDVQGTVDPIYLVGYFALLPSPGPGRHRVIFGGTYSYLGWEIVNSVHFTFAVE